MARVIESALDRPATGVAGHWRALEVFRRSGLYDDLLSGLVSPNQDVRTAAARVCGSLRMADATIWIGDLLADDSPTVRDASARALGAMGGSRAVAALLAADRVPLYRQAISVSRAATDLQVEVLMRQPQTERAAVATVLACGLRRDVLRVPALLGIAHDRRWPRSVRIAACKALAMIADRRSSDGLSRLAQSEPDAGVREVAARAHKRLLRRAVGKMRTK